ncbi:FAD-binding oxidoreductase [bacterium]|nr:FAD-binding oxidoreductase [bacterium]
MPQPKLIETGLQGWGRHRTAYGLAAQGNSIDTLTWLVTGEGPGFLARGAGRSYGDASLNAGHVSFLMGRMDRAISFDDSTGDLVCQPGMTLNDILKAFVPRGWMLPVTPGTGHPTLGGSVACDVHGKNHHMAGTLSNHIQWLDLLTASGEVVRCSETENPDLFAATVGGLCLTGVIVQLCIRLKRVESAWIVEESVRANSLSEMMERLTVSDETHPYTVAWMDCAMSGSRLGRGQVLLGSHATREQFPHGSDRDLLNVPGLRPLPVPVIPPFSLVNNFSVRVFNTLRISQASDQLTARLVPFWPFFYPLDVANNWNRLYGKAGFIQYQFVVPFEAGEQAVREVVVRCQQAGQIPSLVVLKRLGAEGSGHLSFPKPGWTLALDLPIKTAVWPLLDELDRIILAHGGRVYLVKDARLAPETFRAMYPRFGEWLTIKQKVDPKWRFTSNLARRLKMQEGV